MDTLGNFHNIKDMHMPIDFGVGGGRMDLVALLDEFWSRNPEIKSNILFTYKLDCLVTWLKKQTK